MGMVGNVKGYRSASPCPSCPTDLRLTETRCLAVVLLGALEDRNVAVVMRVEHRQCRNAAQGAPSLAGPMRRGHISSRELPCRCGVR